MVDLSQILIGKVLEQVKHPKSRNDLWVHQVDLGGRTQQIIAGAPNAVPGSLVPVALPGTTVPNGKLVKDMNIAGYQASGMLCSANELLLGDDHSGILILDSGTPGAPLTTVIPSQAIMEAEITSNRPDEMGHLGIARELAAGLDRPVKRDFMPSFTGTASPAGRDLVKVSIEDPDLCSRYIGGVIKGVSVGPSPDWLQRRLRACGVRPINNIVDITNYVLLEYAQPLHAFDLARLTGAEIRVRRAREKETLLSLDGVTRDLTPDMLVIADAERPVALAGVIGGEESAVTSATTDVLLESATFNGPNVRQTSRTAGLRTEASARFERSLPPELALAGARSAAHAMRVSNALTDDMDTLRTSLLPSLLDTVALNRDRGRLDVRVYEIAEAYLARVGEKDLQPEEPLRLAAIVMDGRQVGYLGELHPTVTSGARIEGRLVAFEIDVEPLLAASRIRRTTPLPRFPGVERDLAVVVEETVAAGAVLAVIKESAGDLLEQVRAFDEYRGTQVAEGHKSVAFTLTFRSPERTLTDAEVDKVMSEIRLGLEKRHRARFRE